MKMYFFIIENGKPSCLYCEPNEARAIAKGKTVYNSREEVMEALAHPKKAKCRELTPEEQEEQRRWALSMMTEEEKADVAREKANRSPKEMSLYEVEKIQFEFACQMEGWTGKTLERKRKAFARRTYNDRKRFELGLA